MKKCAELIFFKETSVYVMSLLFVFFLFQDFVTEYFIFHRLMSALIRRNIQTLRVI